MEKSIYNVFVPMENQEQCDRMKQLCIDNELPIWDDESAFEFQNKTNDDCFLITEYNEEDMEDIFFVFPKKFNDSDFVNKTEATEQEFIKLLKS